MLTDSWSTNFRRHGTSLTKRLINKLRRLSVFCQKYFLDQGENFERDGESSKHVWHHKHESESERHIWQSTREDNKEMH